MKKIVKVIKLDNMRTKKQGIEAKGVEMFMGNLSETFLCSLLRPGAKILSVLWYNLGAAKLKTVERILFFKTLKIKTDMLLKTQKNRRTLTMVNSFWRELPARRLICVLKNKEVLNMSIFSNIRSLLAELPISDIIRERLNAALEQIRDLESQNAILKAENAVLKAENADLRQKINIIQSKYDTLQNNCDKGVKCPFCRMLASELIRIENDPDFGSHVKHGYYECKNCGKTFDKEMNEH